MLGPSLRRMSVVYKHFCPEAEESLTCSQLKEVCWYVGASGFGHYRNNCGYTVWWKQEPTPHYAIYPFLTETHHFEVEASTSREKWLPCRSSANTRCSVRQNNRRTMTILSTVRRMLYLYLLFTSPSTAFRTRLPWDVLLCQCDVRLTQKKPASAATFMDVHVKISPNSSYWVWQRYRNHSDSHSLVFKEEA